MRIKAKMYIVPAALSGAIAVSVFLASATPAVSAASAASDQPCPLSQPRLLNRNEELSGLLCRSIDGEVFQIVEMTLGATQGMLLAPIQCKLMDSEGVVHELDQRAGASAVFSSLSDIQGCLLRYGGSTTRVLADRVQLGVNAHGFLCVAGYSGVVEHDGQEVSTLENAHAFMPPVCEWQAATLDCVPDGGCTSCKDETSPPNCECNQLGETCSTTFSQTCPSDGICPTGEFCRPNYESPPKCLCTATP